MDLGGGGGERVQVELAKAWQSLGYTVDLVLVRMGGELLPAVPPQIRIVNLECSRLRTAVWRLANYLRENRPLGTVAAMWPLTVIATLAHLIAGRPGRLIVADHGVLSNAPDSQSLGGWLRLRVSIALTYPLAHARVAVSQGVARDVERLGWLPSGSVTVIHNPAARWHGRKQAATDPWASMSGKRILAVGSLRPIKEHVVLIRAFARMRAKRDASLVILGEGDERPALESLTRELGVRAFVAMPGFTLDPYDWFAGADLFVLSSRSEGFGNVIVEAMECGLPVVSTDCPGGPREIIGDGAYGVLTPVGDVAALADAMDQVLDSPRSPERQEARAREFGVERAASRYLTLMMESAGEP